MLRTQHPARCQECQPGWVRAGIVALALILALGLAASCITGSRAFQKNGTNGFPLDDPWIHLQFAKNLHDYGHYSYYKAEMVTSGSTSPLYTLILTLGFFVTTNEMLLSYVLGVCFLLLAASYMFKLASRQFGGNPVYACLGAFLVVLEPRLQCAALWGMETTLFVMLLLAVVYHYSARQSVLLGIAAGLLIWTRPEAVILFMALGIDIAYHRWAVKPARTKLTRTTTPSSMRWLLVPALILAVSALAYFGFNLILSGSILPNTFAAKIKYYAGGGRNFPASVFHFVMEGHWRVVFPLAAAGAILSVLARAVRRQENPFLVSLLWPTGLFLAYWWKLPYLYQYGRYMMPLLPFLMLLGISGFDEVLKLARRATRDRVPQWGMLIARLLLALAVGAQLVVVSWQVRDVYADHCRYISDRQVKTAKWIKEHLPEDAVVATHDIGAIAYYSERKIVDMVGLVSPEMKATIGKPAELVRRLEEKHATHVAVLRSWFEIVNVNPIFQTDERYPEIMEVFEFRPKSMHFMDHEAAGMTWAARNCLAARNVQQAKELLERSVQIDPQSSRTRLFLGRAYLIAGNMDRGQQELQRAIDLNPQYWDARFTLAEVAARLNRWSEARERLEVLLREDPTYVQAYGLLSDAYRQSGDSTRADEYLLKYDELKKSQRVEGLK